MEKTKFIGNGMFNAITRELLLNTLIRNQAGKSKNKIR
jgi:hypothetical protein